MSKRSLRNLTAVCTVAVSATFILGNGVAVAEPGPALPTIPGLDIPGLPGGGGDKPGLPGLPTELPSVPGLPGLGGGDKPAAPSSGAATTSAAPAKPEKDPGPDPCKDIGPTSRQSGGAKPTAKSDAKQIIKGSNQFGADNLIKPVSQKLGLSKELPQGQVLPNLRIFDPDIQGEGDYNQKTQLQSGLVCAITDSLMEKKVRRDVAQKVAQGLLATPTLLAGIEGPDVAALIQSGSACAIAIAQAAAAAAASGGTGGAAAAAAAPSAISAGPPCVAAGGDTARIAGKVINVWEHNPMFPQIVEFAALLNPDSPIGAKVYEKLVKKVPFVGQSAEIKGLMKTLSRFILKLSEVWIGKTIAIFGDAVSKSAAGDTSAVPAASMAAVELGIQLLSAVAYTLTGADELTIACEKVVDVKQLTNQMSTAYRQGLTKMPGEGSEVVAGGALGGQQGTTQQLFDINNPKQSVKGSISNVATQMNQIQLGNGQQGPANVGNDFGNGYGLTTQQVGGYGGQQYAGQQVQQAQGAQQQSLTQNQQAQGAQQQSLTQNQQINVDQQQMLSQADLQSVQQAVPKTEQATGDGCGGSSDKPANGAIFGLDGNDPSSPLGKLPVIGSGGIPGLPGQEKPSGQQPSGGAAPTAPPNGDGGLIPGLPSLPGLGDGGGLPAIPGLPK